jgi:hypothetical protein
MEVVKNKILKHMPEYVLFFFQKKNFFNGKKHLEVRMKIKKIFLVMSLNLKS